MSKNSKSTIFLKECIADAFLRLLRSQNIDKISIEDIVELAGVGRSTYFRNFSSKNEILVFKYRQLWSRWLEDHMLDSELQYNDVYFRAFLEFHYSVKEITKTLNSAGLVHIVFDSIKDAIVPADVQKDSPYYVESCYVHALWGLLERWIARDYKESVDELVAIVKEQLHFL